MRSTTTRTAGALLCALILPGCPGEVPDGFSDPPTPDAGEVLDVRADVLEDSDMPDTGDEDMGADADVGDASEEVSCAPAPAIWALECEGEPELCEGSQTLSAGGESITSHTFSPRGPGSFHVGIEFDRDDPDAFWALFGPVGEVARSGSRLDLGASVELAPLAPYELRVDWASATSGSLRVERASYGAPRTPWPFGLGDVACDHSVGFFEQGDGRGSARSYYVFTPPAPGPYTAKLNALEYSELVLEIRRPGGSAPEDFEDASGSPAGARVEVDTQGDAELSFDAEEPVLLIVHNVSDFVGGPERVALETYTLSVGSGEP